MASNINITSLIDHPFYNDPYLRELHCALDKAIVIDKITNSLYVYDRKNKDLIHEVDLSDLRQLCYSLTIKSGRLPDGKIHEWVSESDGSANKLREFLKISV